MLLVSSSLPPLSYYFSSIYSCTSCNLEGKQGGFFRRLLQPPISPTYFPRSVIFLRRFISTTFKSFYLTMNVRINRIFFWE